MRANEGGKKQEKAGVCPAPSQNPMSSGMCCVHYPGAIRIDALVAQHTGVYAQSPRAADLETTEREKAKREEGGWEIVKVVRLELVMDRLWCFDCHAPNMWKYKGVRGPSAIVG